MKKKIIIASILPIIALVAVAVVMFSGNGKSISQSQAIDLKPYLTEYKVGSDYSLSVGVANDKVIRELETNNIKASKLEDFKKEIKNDPSLAKITTSLNNIDIKTLMRKNYKEHYQITYNKDFYKKYGIKFKERGNVKLSSEKIKNLARDVYNSSSMKGDAYLSESSPKPDFLKSLESEDENEDEPVLDEWTLGQSLKRVPYYVSLGDNELIFSDLKGPVGTMKFKSKSPTIIIGNSSSGLCINGQTNFSLGSLAKKKFYYDQSQKCNSDFYLNKGDYFMIDYSGTSIDQYLQSTEKFRDELGDQSMIYNEGTYKEDRYTYMLPIRGSYSDMKPINGQNVSLKVTAFKDKHVDIDFDYTINGKKPKSVHLDNVNNPLAIGDDSYGGICLGGEYLVESKSLDTLNPKFEKTDRYCSINYVTLLSYEN